MKSKTELSNTLSQNKKIRTIVLVASVSVVSILIIVGSCYWVKTHKELSADEQQYLNLLDEYNDSVAQFNNSSSAYNSLLTGLKSRGVTVNGETSPDKVELDSNYKEFFKSNGDLNKLADQVTAVNSETTVLNERLSSMEIEYYNDMIGQYNDMIIQYNANLEQLASYAKGTLPDSMNLLEEVVQAKSTWIDIDSYFVDYDSLCGDTASIEPQYLALCKETYNDVIRDYNLVAEAYNEAVSNAAVDFISGMDKEVKLKEELSEDELKDMATTELLKSIEVNLIGTRYLAESYTIVMQITNPSEDFVMERLSNVSNIVSTAAVTKDNDPNGLLGKDGGYTSCIYFTLKEIDSNTVEGDGVIGKGTDAGGAVEVYATLEDALNRCDYLSQFDGTLLYSGSYAIIGTTVIRTSYKLDEEKQIQLTSEITQALTKIG